MQTRTALHSAMGASSQSASVEPITAIGNGLHSAMGASSQSASVEPITAIGNGDYVSVDVEMAQLSWTYARTMTSSRWCGEMIFLHQMGNSLLWDRRSWSDKSVARTISSNGDTVRFELNVIMEDEEA